MKYGRILGIAFLLLGALLISDGLRQEPRETLRVVAGVLIVLAGILRIVKPDLRRRP